ncbi:pyruvate kinase [Sulfuricella sp. T08]|uniref:pyruvate kinase n=1 Tax=Sulfuricella sp. T08 TaxID=1632857 RepID=UPI000617A147|nr:pyruvate kinase [Sulfuricella sp. T08]
MGNMRSGTKNGKSRDAILKRVTLDVEQIRKDAVAIEDELADILRRTVPGYSLSACNLAHYLAVRRHDIRDLQRELGRIGLSSLGRMEAHVMASLDAVFNMICILQNIAVPEQVKRTPSIKFEEGNAILADHANAIMGPAPAECKVRIMVTMPSEAATEPSFIYKLLAQGMNIMRINCAHDNPDDWVQMVGHLRQAEKALGRSCKVCFDLAGPKVRTWLVEPAEGVIKWRPQRNRLGQFGAPALVRFVKEVPGANLESGMVPIRGDLLAKAKVGDFVELLDARARVRTLRIIEVSTDDCLCLADHTAYVTEGVKLSLRRKRKIVGTGTVGTLPLSPQTILIKPDDILDVVKGEILGRDAVRDDKGHVVEPAIVGCPLAEVFSSVRRGERILFDDGKIAGTIQSVTKDRIKVKITGVAGGVAKLGDEKGINLPDTDLKVQALSPKDLSDLAFMVKHGDMVAMSFVQKPKDIEDLIAALKHLDASHLGIVLKIETQQAFSCLPNLLLTAMQHSAVAVMIARGDLGVEVGFERLSEVQEEILWLCEAAHIPVIWATQVLESLAKGGMPSRAEVTDAAMSTRAECVMLNKGPYILQTLKFLRDVLNRMETHQEKKTAMLRRLSISNATFP